MSIALGVAQRNKRVVDVVLGAKLLEGFTSELRAIIGYNNFWNTKATKHIFPYEFHKVVYFDLSIGFRFHPLNKIIGSHQQKNFLRESYRQ